MINLNDVAKQAHTLVELRGYKTDAISCLKHCAGEVVEATEAYMDFAPASSLNDAISVLLKVREEFAMELADIIICALTASAEYHIDIEEAINKSMQKNARRAYGTEEA